MTTDNVHHLKGTGGEARSARGMIGRHLTEPPRINLSTKLATVDDQADLETASSIAMCDAGACDEPRVALVLTPDLGWLPLCRKHALLELEAAKR